MAAFSSGCLFLLVFLAFLAFLYLVRHPLMRLAGESLGGE